MSKVAKFSLGAVALFIGGTLAYAAANVLFGLFMGVIAGAILIALK